MAPIFCGKGMDHTRGWISHIKRGTAGIVSDSKGPAFPPLASSGLVGVADAGCGGGGGSIAALALDRQQHHYPGSLV